jgi:hypothetical protein
MDRALYHQCRHYPDFIHESTTNSVYHHKSHGQYQQTTPTDDRYRFLVHEDDPIQAAASGYPCQSHYDGHSCRILRNYIEPTVPAENTIGTFDEYISSLDEWESQLLSSIELLATPQEIMASLNHAPFCSGSNGSVIIESATFGVVTATATGTTRLFHIRGAAPGSRPQSFRAEGYGGLALVCLLIRLAQYTGIALHQSFMHFLDNTSFIKRVSKALSQSWTSPNSTGMGLDRTNHFLIP